jgi:TolB-like protein
MKRRSLFFILVLAAGFVSAQQVSLDTAIANAAQAINERLNTGIKIVVLNFYSPSERLSNYALDELTGAIVNGGKLTAVDRQNLALIQQEMNFQMSGEVSDASAQEIGAKLGAQSIISGSLEDMGTFYRVRFRVIEVVSAAIQAQTSADVQRGGIVATLLGTAASGSTASSRTTTLPASYPDGLRFSTGRKVGAGFLNWIYGIGSFTMGDWAGGLIVGGTELVGTIVIIATLANATYESYDYNGYYEDKSSISVGGLLIGLGLQLGGQIYGHIRPFQYDRSLARKSGYAYNPKPWQDNPLEHVDIQVVPTSAGPGALRLSYSLQF